MADGTQTGSMVVANDLPEWYKQYTQNLAQNANTLAGDLNSAPLPAQSVAGFNQDQQQAFANLRANQGVWQPQLNAAAATSGQIAPTAAKFIDYAQGAVGAPAFTTAGAVQPWAQGAQDAASGSAQDWTQNYSKYMSPYTSEVVDNIARLGKRNWEDTIMPGVNSAMIGSGQFGSTRNADILTKAGLSASQDILGQQSNALQAGYNSAAGIFGSDANRAQAQQQLQANTALAGGNMMQGALSADANRIQGQGQLQANTALSGATGAVNALNTASDNSGALAQLYQSMGQSDVNALSGVGAQQQSLQQKGYDTAFGNAQLARTDPWTQLTNQQGVLSNIKLPTLQSTAQSGQVGTPPTTADSIASAMFTAAGLLNGGTKK